MDAASKVEVFICNGWRRMQPQKERYLYVIAAKGLGLGRKAIYV